MNLPRFVVLLSWITAISCGGLGQPEPGDLLAVAASSARPFELRLPGADYLPYRPTRAGTQRGSPPELAEAEAILLRRTSGGSESASDLVLLSRVHVLRGQWDDAVEKASLAQDLAANKALDAGVAYLGRGLARRKPRDLEQAVEQLSEALTAGAESQTALFNRAIALESLFLYRRAASDCRVYLEIDPAGGWADEVRQRLQRVERTVEDWETRLDGFESLDPSRAREAPPELAQEAALTEWLPQLAGAPAEPDSPLRRRLETLAVRLTEKHGDTWLRDLLAGRLPAEGVRALGLAVQANRTAKRDEALKLARKAKKLFEQDGDLAGALRARVEEVYALSRSFRPNECLQGAARSRGLLAGRRYVWIEAQLELERAACAFHLTQFGAALRGMRRARERSAAAGYDILALRAYGLEAAAHTQLGDLGPAIESNWRGLEMFWTGAHPPSRAFQFYSDLYLAAERQQRWRAAHAYAREATEVVAAGPNRLMEAMARTRLAGFALHVGEPREAMLETQKASAILKRFENEASAVEYRIDNAVVLANSHLAAGEVDLADRVVSDIGGADGASVVTRLALRRTLGALHERRAEWGQAKQEYLDSIRIEQSSSSGLSGDAERLRWRRESGRAARSLVGIFLEQENDPEAALRAWEWHRSAPVRWSPQPAGGGLPDANKHRLGLGSYSAASVVSWAEIGERLAIWMYDDRGVHFAWSPLPLARCRALCSRFARLCARPDSSLEALRETGRQLYQALFEPVEGFLDPRRVLLVEPDNVPGTIAYEALVGEHGRWLGERFEIVTTPGLWTELSLRERRRFTSPARALLIGNPAHVPLDEFVLEPLADAAREVEWIARLFDHPRLLVGAAATPGAVAAALESAEVFHFAGHAYGDAESANLLLAGEGALLTAETLGRQAQQCRLAVLSACSTAGGERGSPWNAEGLVQAFWRAGTPDVVASRWEVDSATTARLFEVFYRRLVDSNGVAQALRYAATEVRGRPETAHPYYWAAFHVFGCAPAAGPR